MRLAWSLELDEDVFSHILSFVFDSHTIYKILRAIPTTNPFFSRALNRLCQLPIYLSSGDQSTAATFDILERLLSSSSDASSASSAPTPTGVVDAIRHLIITLTSEPPRPLMYERLAELLSKARNLRILDWGGSFFPPAESFNTLQTLEKLKTFRIDVSADSDEIYSGWEPDHFACTLGPLLNSLELRSVDIEVYRSLESQYNRFSSYHSLHHLSVDITAGTWDWDLRGSPQMGATDKFVFKNLGFPALTEFEMRVSDLTLNADRPGPMELVDWEPLKYLRLTVVHCFMWTSLRDIQLFVALPPQGFPSLTTLRIDDETWAEADWKWDDDPPEEGYNEFGEIGRCYRGLVPLFLASIQSGLLQNLVNLWVDQRVLCMPTTTDSLQHTEWAGDSINFYSVKDLWSYDPEHGNDEELAQKREWVATLRFVFGRIESLRVGLGPMDDFEVGIVLDCCSPSKLQQFGFQWNWRAYGHEDPISPEVLGHFSCFPNLTDIHLLLPRPGTQKIFTSPDPAINFRTINDISLIFSSNPALCRVGVGRNTVWERQCFSTGTGTAAGNVILGHDGWVDERLLRTEAIPRFYDAGELDDAVGSNQYESRPSHLAEIEELRCLLERIFDDSHH